MDIALFILVGYFLGVFTAILLLKVWVAIDSGFSYYDRGDIGFTRAMIVLSWIGAIISILGIFGNIVMRLTRETGSIIKWIFDVPAPKQKEYYKEN